MSIKALIGLGNEGTEYERTYHNIGEFVARQINIAAAEEGSELNVYPVTGFMNNSGQPVQKWLKLNNIHANEFVVAHDDSDLPIGSYRLSHGGGSAGHKGIESLVAHLGTPDFWRLRIGVRDPEELERQKAGDFILERWSGAQEKEFLGVCKKAWEGLKKI